MESLASLSRFDLNQAQESGSKPSLAFERRDCDGAIAGLMVYAKTGASGARAFGMPSVVSHLLCLRIFSIGLSGKARRRQE